MVQNLPRKLVLIAALLLTSIGLVFFQDQPFRMGLDLQGGTRIVYRFDFDKLQADTQASQLSRAELVQQTINIIQNRMDAETKGTLEAVIRQEGLDRIVIELPRALDTSGDPAEAALATVLEPADGLLTLSGGQIDEFPARGGVIQIGEEKIRYERRDDAQLVLSTRGYQETQRLRHEEGAEVRLLSNDAVRNAIENLGRLAFHIVTDFTDFQTTGGDLTTEAEALRSWLAANPGQTVEDYNYSRAGSPTVWKRWDLPPGDLPPIADHLATQLPEGQGYASLLNIAEDPDDRFSGADLASASNTFDQYGGPAVAFEMKPARRSDFADFTGRHVDRQMAIVLNDQISSAPVIEGRLPGGGRITNNNFTIDEVRELITVLQTGSLPLEPILDYEEVVGPSLGETYVKLGQYSALLGLGAVLAFMIVYYRRLGIYAAISLGSTLMLLMGGLAFLQATLTLPGIAGIILTVGMAVDANILIFDRIREEMDKGRNVKQAAKNGFEQAMSAIVDANLTTLLTALVLYNVGTGPVKGFAVTLSIGILTSMFAALVITRVLMHFAMSKSKVEPFTMGQWMVKANFSPLSKAKLASTVSAVALVGGLALFFSIPDREKLGIDFLGGEMVMFRTESPADTEEIRTRIKGLPGSAKKAEVKPVLNLAGPDGGYTGFRVTSKGDGETEGDGEDSRQITLKTDIETAFEDVLQRGPVVIEPAGDGRTRLSLYFRGQHTLAEVESQLAQVDLVREPSVEVAPDNPRIFHITASTAAGATDTAILNGLRQAFEGQATPTGGTFELTGPILEARVISPQVVGDLRDKAILALLISLFLIVMYIRVRFAEYSYGFAAVTALVHDVLITLGVLALAMKTGLVEVEVNLPLIAAFLTIIGYSLNDTIVLFDRVRENLPRMDTPLEETLNTSINQTLSRTILTSVTTFLAVAILFAFNLRTGNVLEGFSFAMLIGVLVGTYSSIFIAAPVFLWLENRSGGAQREAKAAKKAALVTP